MAKLPACYDGVMGARGVNELRAYGLEKPETVYDDNAYTNTSIYYSGTGTLQIYTIHPTKPTDPGISLEYYMTQLNCFAMTGNAETFRKGASASRNVGMSL